ncbi:Do family serine endopeptidase [Pseudodesulfovibrio sp.]|uniref:Do family serine endopeptidase n=1 Tax=Pseudodesulfovibrio sp. TaxID=2035812 RepID=UPI00260AB07D|nr:Do family serine endopeptidase [Pseudodesulfovibrio sp.]MDD3312438.1 Do family serine endopeptidase [Pseudodesulfovibrio sp.]
MIRHLKTTTLFLTLLLAMPTMGLAANGLPVFTELAAKAGKSVVFISTEMTAREAPGSMGFQGQIPDNHPFKEFFEQFDQFFGPRGIPGQPGQPRQPRQPRKRMAQGSGFVITPDGQIVTNNHVIDGADKITVRFQDDPTEYPAKVVGRDTETDLAVIKIDAPHPLPVLAFGDSDSIQVGEWVLAVGNPYGLDNTVTAGIISAKHRIIGAGPFDNFLQTDASINPGNSGGPLLNMNGDVIGINTAINAAAENIGFAIPSTEARKIVDQLREGKPIQRGWLGVTIQPVSENDAKALGLDKPEGALIASVGKGHPADKAGVRQGDVILEVNGQAVHNNNDLLRRIADLRPGDKAHLSLWRDGKVINRTVTLGERDEKNMAAMSPNQQGPQEASAVLGMSLRPVTAQDARALGLDKPAGLVVVQVTPDSVAGEGGVRPGDVILQANQEEVKTPDALQSILKRDATRGAVMLLIKRQGQNAIVSLPLDKK